MSTTEPQDVYTIAIQVFLYRSKMKFFEKIVLYRLKQEKNGLVKFKACSLTTFQSKYILD
jgi:hypothetical protein